MGRGVETGFACLQNHFLRTRLYVDPRSGRKLRLGFGLRQHCAAVARRLHHPQRVLGNIRDAYEANPDLVFLGADPYFKNILENCLPAWRKVVAKAVECGIPMPCMASAITFLDGYTTERLPANLLQAQRDYFGAHTYERTDKPRGEFFHTNWTGKGGDTASTTYDI